MRPEEPLASSCAVLVNNKAFVNSNGWPLGLLVSPQPPQSLPTPAIAVPPPVWLAVVIDGSMADEPLAAAASGLSQALLQLPPHTHLLVSVTTRVAAFFDLASPNPQSWVLASGAAAAPGGGGAGGALLQRATPRLLRASGVRPTPLSACASSLQVALASLRRTGAPAHGGAGVGGAAAAAAPEDDDGRVEERRRLVAAAATIDLSLHLLGRSMAEWDARHKAELAAANAAAPSRPTSPKQQAFPSKPMHSARVLFITASGLSAPGAPPPAPHDPKHASEIQGLFDVLGSKAAALDAQLDVIVGDAAAPALPFLPDAVAACGGMLLHQPALSAPLAANLVAMCGRRLGWDAFIDVRTPAGIKVRRIVGPVLQTDGQQLPASISPVDLQPLGLSPASGQQQDGGEGAGAQQEQQEVVQPRVVRPAVAPTKLTAAAVALPAIDRGRFYGASLELVADLQAGAAQEVQVLWEWTTADGRRVRQVSSTQLQVGERLPDFLSGLDLEAGSLLAARRLVASALNATGGVGGRGGGWGRALRRSGLADARLAAGLALQQVAQRMGVARQARRGLFGFGAQTVWELPVALVPFAVAMYLLQAGPLMNADEDGATPAAADAWRLRAHQFLAAVPSIGACIASPCLYVQLPPSPGDRGGVSGGSVTGGGFQPVPPVNLAVGPQSLAVLDCGTELFVYAGPASLQPHAPPLPTPAPPADAVNGTGAAAASAAAAESAAGGSEDLPMAAAPAVQFAHQLLRGRLPVPSIQVLQDARSVGVFMSRLAPLHVDVLPVQMVLMPALRELSPQEHGELIQWHAQWAPAPQVAGFGHFCTTCGVSLPVEGGLMECVVEDE